MKNRFLVYFLAIFTFFSCKNQQEEISDNSFYQANYEFSNKVLNRYKREYYLKIEEQPSRKIDELNQLDSRFQLLISNIDKAISNKDSNLEEITSEYNKILNAIPKIVNNRKDYLSSEFKPIKSNSNELNLNYIKNRLSIAMTYAFEYANRTTYASDKLITAKINSYSSKIGDNGIKVSLTSNLELYKIKNRHIIVNKIEFNGREKKVEYTLKERYSFVDFEFDSLQKGTYRINGIFRFYEGNKKIDIPINEVFTVK
ncbi:hypothetical protein [Psychroserpens ponticola]|uniref:Gliding motility-associated protein GldM N-terminal domain-containing protein n=1 Tax=Psychroserpens ponticola TaxID=2932268 RepID=A0ABY7S6H4_9FLAO|nr:hypothetical protein [Psychroserpens ponticola]WCO03495.1 hypothetical protein MUN68_008295 [Psychroserpens ponticola]